MNNMKSSKKVDFKYGNDVRYMIRLIQYVMELQEENLESGEEKHNAFAWMIN